MRQCDKALRRGHGPLYTASRPSRIATGRRAAAAPWPSTRASRGDTSAATPRTYCPASHRGTISTTERSSASSNSWTACRLRRSRGTHSRWGCGAGYWTTPNPVALYLARGRLVSSTHHRLSWRSTTSIILPAVHAAEMSTVQICTPDKERPLLVIRSGPAEARKRLGNMPVTNARCRKVDKTCPQRFRRGRMRDRPAHSLEVARV